MQRQTAQANDTNIPVPGLTVADALGAIARLSPVPNVVRSLHRFEVQVWVTDGDAKHGFFHRWATCDAPAEAESMVRLMTAAGLKVSLIDLAVTRGGRGR